MKKEKKEDEKELLPVQVETQQWKDGIKFTNELMTLKGLIPDKDFKVFGSKGQYMVVVKSPNTKAYTMIQEALKLSSKSRDLTASLSRDPVKEEDERLERVLKIRKQCSDPDTAADLIKEYTDRFEANRPDVPKIEAELADIEKRAEELMHASIKECLIYPTFEAYQELLDRKPTLAGPLYTALVHLMLTGVEDVKL